MPITGKSKKQRLLEYLAEKKLAAVDEAEWARLIELLRPISEGYLRDMLAATGLRVAQPFGGILVVAKKPLYLNALPLSTFAVYVSVEKFV